MKLNKYTVGLLLLFIGVGCTKPNEVSIDEVFSKFSTSKDSIAADGQSTLVVWVELNTDASPERRKVRFTTTLGTFENSKNQEEVVTASYANGHLIAQTQLVAPFKSGVFTIAIDPEFDSPYKEYQLRKTIVATKSEPASIKISPSQFGIGSNFIDQVEITANVKNAEGKNISSGYKVRFEDLIGTAAAQGRFSAPITSIDNASKAVTKYSATSLAIGTQITVRANVVNASGDTIPGLHDHLILTINQ